MNKQDSKPVLPVCFCIHRNGSMGARTALNGREVSRLNLVAAGIRNFVETGLSPNAPYELDAAVLVFSGSTMWIQKFGTVTYADQIPDLKYDGVDCCLGEALAMALDAIENRVERSKREGQECLRPILVMVSAGNENYGRADVLSRSSERCGALIQQQKLTAVMYAMTTRANEELLRSAAPGGTVEYVRTAEIIDKLSGIGSYAQANVHRLQEPLRDASPYILGIYTDVLQGRG